MEIDFLQQVPKVSIIVLTYYHEKYIEEALESILNQKTNFAYEIQVGDDLSKDGTRKILLEYEKKHPNKIKLNFNETNVGVSQNFYNIICQCNGEFISILAGDDYYIDELALQKQVDFLEEHKEYHAVATCVESRVSGSQITTERFPTVQYRDYEITLDDFLKNISLPMLGLMFRNEVDGQRADTRYSILPVIHRNIEDFTFCVILLKTGRVYINGEFLVGHRVFEQKHNAKNYNTNTKKIKKYEDAVNVMNGVYDYYQREIDLMGRYVRASTIGFINAILTKSLKAYKEIYKTIPSEYRKPWFGKKFMVQVLINVIPTGLKYLRIKILRKYNR